MGVFSRHVASAMYASIVLKVAWASNGCRLSYDHALASGSAAAWNCIMDTPSTIKLTALRETLQAPHAGPR